MNVIWNGGAPRGADGGGGGGVGVGSVSVNVSASSGAPGGAAVGEDRGVLVIVAHQWCVWITRDNVTTT